MSHPQTIPFIRIDAGDVEIGMYVKLGCPWFKHPFPRNTFKVQTRAELIVLRSLNHIPLYMDPSKSDHHSVPACQADSILMTVDPRPAPGAVAPDNDHAAHIMAKKEEALKAFLHCQEKLKTAQARHAEALRQTKEVIEQVLMSREGCASNMLHMIERVTTALDETGRALAVLNINNSDEFGSANYSSLHALNVFVIAMMMGRELELSKADLLSLGVGALLHDIGERKVSNQVLLKYRKGEELTRAERTFFELHPEYGYRIIEGIGGFSEAAAQVVFQHHERTDGSGYPRRLKEDAICLVAKIVMVADEYEHLTNTLDLTKRLSPTEAFAHLYQKRREVLPEHVIVCLIHVLGIYPPGTFVRLSDETVGMVIQTHCASTTRPSLVVYEADASAEQGVLVNLLEEPGLTIEKVLRPTDVPIYLREHWAARRMAGYFIHWKNDSERPAIRG